MIRPFLISLRMSQSLYFEVRSMPEEGSSSRISLDPAISEIATESLRLVPPERFCE